MTRTSLIWARAWLIWRSSSKCMARVARVSLGLKQSMRANPKRMLHLRRPRIQLFHRLPLFQKMPRLLKVRRRQSLQNWELRLLLHRLRPVDLHHLQLTICLHQYHLLHQVSYKYQMTMMTTQVTIPVLLRTELRIRPKKSIREQIESTIRGK